MERGYTTYMSFEHELEHRDRELERFQTERTERQMSQNRKFSYRGTLCETAARLYMLETSMETVQKT